MKVLDQEVDKLGGQAKLVAVWLTDDKEKTKEYLPKAQQSLNFDATTLALHPDLSTGPDGWGINSDADLTVVVAGDKKVAARFGFVSPNEKVVREVLAALKKATKRSSAGLCNAKRIDAKSGSSTMTDRGCRLPIA